MQHSPGRFINTKQRCSLAGEIQAQQEPPELAAPAAVNYSYLLFVLALVVLTLLPLLQDQPEESGSTRQSSPSKQGSMWHHHFSITMEAGKQRWHCICDMLSSSTCGWQSGTQISTLTQMRLWDHCISAFQEFSGPPRTLENAVLELAANRIEPMLCGHLS